MGGPVVSVVTTVHDGERYLAESMASVLTQEGVDLELVVVDDGSTDGTGRVLDAVDDPRVVRIDRPHEGRARALNTALAACRAPYVAVHDADDRCLPGRLATSVAALDADPGLDLVGSGWWVFINAGGDEVGRRRVPATDDAGIRRLLVRHHAPFAHSSVTVRRSALDRVGGYDDELPLDLDLDLLVRVAADGRLGAVPEALVATRRHPDRWFAGRRGPARSLRRRVAARRTVDARARTFLEGRPAPGPTVTLAREAGSWAYWWGHRLVGDRPLLPAGVRRRLDERWARGG